jgi:hypothetical protein
MIIMLEIDQLDLQVSMCSDKEGEGSLHLLDDKVAAVTGGSRGIGAAISIGAVRHGAKVALPHHGDVARAETVVAEI